MQFPSHHILFIPTNIIALNLSKLSFSQIFKLRREIREEFWQCQVLMMKEDSMNVQGNTK